MIESIKVWVTLVTLVSLGIWVVRSVVTATKQRKITYKPKTVYLPMPMPRRCCTSRKKGGWKVKESKMPKYKNPPLPPPVYGAIVNQTPLY